MKQAFQVLLRSRKFLLLIADAVGSTLLYFVAKYLNPSIAEDVLTLYKYLQPIVVAVILGIAIEDAAVKWGGGNLGD